MNDGRTDPPAPGAGGRWPLRRWLALVALVFAAQAGFIFALGERHFKPPRVAANVPQLQLADETDERIALDDPTLFALPHANDFASAVWLQTPAAPPPSFRWTEPPRPLSLAVENLGAVFAGFMQTNRFAGSQPGFRLEPELSAPVAPLQPAFAEHSTLRIEGDLTQRRLLTPVDLPSWPYPDVIAPCKVQTLVDAAGEVVSAVPLPPDNPAEAASHYDAADQLALELARAARFAPAPRRTLGLLIFNWRTVPPPAPDAPSRLP